MQLATDYARLVTAARDVVALRLPFQKQVCGQHFVQAKVIHNSQLTQLQTARKGKKKESLEDIGAIQSKLDKLSQTIRRELEHFDYTMRDEFEESFGAYNATYWASLHKTRRNTTAVVERATSRSVENSK